MKKAEAFVVYFSLGMTVLVAIAVAVLMIIVIYYPSAVPTWMPMAP